MLVDRTDRRILEALERQARLPNKDLARQVGLSESACLERVRKLERSGAIIGYRAMVAPAALGRAFEGMAEISLSNLPSDAIVAFDELIQRKQEILAATRISGHCDFLLHFAAPDVSHWRALCADLDQIGVGPGRVRLGVVISRSKS